MNRYYVVEINSMDYPRWRVFIDRGFNGDNTCRNIEPLDSHQGYEESWNEDCHIAMKYAARHHGHRTKHCVIEIEYCQ